MPFVRQRRRRSAVLSVGVSLFVFAGCADGEPKMTQRDVLLLAQPDADFATRTQIVTEQRRLLGRLATGHSVEDLVTPDFSIRNDHSAIPSESGYRAQREQLALLAALNAHPGWADSVFEGADLAAYLDFHTHELSELQVVVLAHDEEGSTILTTWHRSGANWKAAGMVMNPSPAHIALLHERSSQRAGLHTQH
jgi:hypothetical protein